MQGLRSFEPIEYGVKRMTVYKQKRKKMFNFAVMYPNGLSSFMQPRQSL